METMEPFRFERVQHGLQTSACLAIEVRRSPQAGARPAAGK